MNYTLVKMDGDYRLPPPKWHLWRRLVDRIQGVKYMPESPQSHPDCLEILEGSDRGPLKTVYKRNS